MPSATRHGKVLTLEDTEYTEAGGVSKGLRDASQQGELSVENQMR